jgi:hypothetical protein
VRGPAPRVTKASWSGALLRPIIRRELRLMPEFLFKAEPGKLVARSSHKFEAI